MVRRDLCVPFYLLPGTEGVLSTKFIAKQKVEKKRVSLLKKVNSFSSGLIYL